jgi:hypothetical protein
MVVFVGYQCDIYMVGSVLILITKKMSLKILKDPFYG